MNPLQFANSMYGLGKICSIYPNLLIPKTMHRSIVKHTGETLPQMSEQELGNTLWALGIKN